MTNKLRQIITDDEKRIRIQFICVYAILGSVSLFMTVMNVFSHQPLLLTMATLVFGVLSVLNCLMVLKSLRLIALSELFFIVEITVLFTYFIIGGTPEGFSAIWILLIPSCGMFLLQRKLGSVLACLMFLELIFLFWTPFGRALLRYPYTGTFMTRFPVLYVAFYLVGLFLETIRALTFENYEHLYRYDVLTNVMNRRGFTEYMAKAYKNTSSANVGFMIFDLDLFKNVNDRLGHLAGDEMLKQTAEHLEKIVGLPICRWGGEEFAAFDPSGSLTQEKLSAYCRSFEETDIVIDGKKVPQTISIGGVLMPRDNDESMNHLLSQADAALYNAKAKGRNCVEFLDFSG